MDSVRMIVRDIVGWLVKDNVRAKAREQHQDLGTASGHYLETGLK